MLCCAMLRLVFHAACVRVCSLWPVHGCERRKHEDTEERTQNTQRLFQ